jgi:hypothetical protein
VRLLGDALHRTFLFQPVANQVGDGADLEIVTLRELFEVGTARHGAVVIQDLDDRRGGLEASETSEITARLSVPRASEHAAGLRHQRKDVTRLTQIFRLGFASNRRTNGLRTIVSGDAGRHTLCRFDRKRKVGAMTFVGVAHHQRQTQLFATIASERETDQAACIAGHEIYILGAHELRGHDQVAFVFAILIVHDDDHFSGANVRQNFIDRIQFHAGAFSRSR